jgi:hypothetical protein
MSAIDFGLPSTGTESPPGFLTPVACHDWLATIPMANPAQAQAMFLRQLNLLHRYTLPALQRFELLEALRPTTGDVQDDMAKKFAGKPLPFTPPEQAALDGNLAVWQALLNGYLRCLEAVAAGDAGIAPHRATVAQRAIAVFADWQVDLCRGEQLPDASFWKRLHQTFAAAESLGIAGEAVDDAIHHGNTRTSALGAYGEVHLMQMASPYELPQRHLNWIARWSRRWGSKLSLLVTPPTELTNVSMPLFVDLASDRPASYMPRSGGQGRWLETSELRKSIKTRLVMLERGEQPSRLQLGEDCTQPAAGQLLERVYQRWCKGGAPRRQERKPASGGAEFIVGLEAVHYYLSGRKPFRPPTNDDSMLRKEREELATFGGRATHQDADYSEQRGYQVENWAILDDWQLMDQSASGLRLSRPLKAGVRVGTGQLIAVKLAGSSNFVTGSVRWALHEPDAAGNPTLAVGVQLFPGVVQSVGVRPIDPGLREKYRQGLMLPAIPALKEPEAVIVPIGTFRIGRPLEIWLGEKNFQKLNLVGVLDRGSEFERCTYKPA